MFCKRTLALRHKLRLSFSTPCSTACLFPFARCRSTAVRSSPPTSNRLVSSAVCTCSCCAVERANRTHSEEFYQVTPCSLEMRKLNRELRQWEKIYRSEEHTSELQSRQ